MSHQIDSKDPSDLIEVRESDGKGLGVFAKCDIPQGTRVISEPPLLEVSLEDRDANMILAAFKQLPLPQQEQYLALHEYAAEGFKRGIEAEVGQLWEEIPELDRKVLSIWAPNAFINVFLLAARINHSCLPNLQYGWHPELKHQTFHAVCDIPAGTELTVSYIGPINGNKMQRQEELKDWGFTCSCVVCEDTPEGKEKEKKFDQLFHLETELVLETHIATEGSFKRALSVAQKMAAIQKSEGILHRELRIAYHDAGRLCMVLGNRKMACLWAKKELEVAQYCFGEDHPACKELAMVVDLLQEAMESKEPVNECIVKWCIITHRNEILEDSCKLM
ncbi:hypothetical protein N7452_000509 [Penicillium brevicompactum]|uniref:SET domain-containing protein n=1 Tax=Penicillium brevicompactum TaxID=5074 RepID=A0A9W9UQ99_PENBR|nr:hypothetical protein N7452_000509 [Penicillium brevicompactum]